jgi:hypothetical protein
MRGLILAALAFGVSVVPIPQGSPQPSRRIINKDSPSSSQPPADTQKNQQSAEAGPIQAILTAITQIQQQQAEEQKTEAYEKKNTIDLEWWLVWVGIVQAAALILTIWAIIRQTGVLQNTAKKQLRAYVGVSECGLKLEPPNIPEGQVNVKNCGQTPAYKVRHWVGIAVLPHPLVSKLPEPPGGLQSSVSILPPGGHHTLVVPVKTPIRACDLPSLYSPEHTVYVYGQIVYEDIFGDEWSTDYRFFCGGLDGIRTKKDSRGVLLGLMQPDSKGNDAI